jgi:hypothetical protein
MSTESNNSRKPPLVEPSQIEILKPEKKISVSKGAKRGRKPSSHNPTAPRRRRRNLPPGTGAKRLLNSVNVILSDESDAIARALVDKTIAGDIKSAHLLIELSGLKHPSANSDEDGGPSLAEMILSSGEWIDDEQWKKKLGSDEWNSRVGSEQWNKPLSLEEWNQNLPLPGETLHDFNERTLRYLPPPKPAP